MYELIAQEITKSLAPWLWEEFTDTAKSQSLMFRSERQISRFQLQELVLEVEVVVDFASKALQSTLSGLPSNGRDYFDYEVDAVNRCIRDLQAFLRVGRRLHLDELDNELEGLRKSLLELLKEIRLPSPLQIDMLASKYQAKLKPYFLERRATDANGNLISKDSDERAWLELRKTGLTSTDAGKLIRFNGERRVGWEALFETKLPGYEPEFFDSYALGVEREPKVAEWVIEQFPQEGFFHNEFTYLSTEDERFMTTPDLVGDFSVCEIKVSSADLKTNLQRYRDQIQWHMMVLDAPVCLFVVENRYDQSKSCEWVNVDQKRVDALTRAAEEWLEEYAEWLEDGDVF